MSQMRVVHLWTANCSLLLLLLFIITITIMIAMCIHISVDFFFSLEFWEWHKNKHIHIKLTIKFSNAWINLSLTFLSNFTFSSEFYWLTLLFVCSQMTSINKRTFIWNRKIYSLKQKNFELKWSWERQSETVKVKQRE